MQLKMQKLFKNKLHAKLILVIPASGPNIYAYIYKTLYKT